MSKDIQGLDGFIWWTGVVENRQDPLNLCRCQIRIFGWHQDDLNMIPSADLPWAHPAFAVNSTTINKTPKEGDWVIGFFMDGKSGQFPCYFGYVPGIPEFLPDNAVGFSDPADNLAERPSYLTDGNAQQYPSILNEPSTSRLYRNEMTDQTVLGVIAENLVTGIPTADGQSWDQPDTSYDAVPPYNDVHETESGHVFELDDTVGAERIHLAHRTGTHIEMRPDGSRMIKVEGTNYEIIAGDDYVNITGTCNITVNGNANIQVDGDVTALVQGNVDATVNGNVTAQVDGNVDATIGGNVTASVGGDMSASISGSMSQSVGGSYSINSGGSFTVSAASINLN
jgi:Gp5 N-terminal OB domain